MAESIYNLVPQEYVVPPKEPMYHSKHDTSQGYAGSTFGCTGSTRLIGAGKLTKMGGRNFGPRAGESPPNSPLRNSSKEVLSPSGKFTYSETRKPKVPTVDEAPVYGIKSTRNFITTNAVEAILQAPRIVESKEPDYLKKEDYGKVPAYLTQVKEEIRRENEMIQRYVNTKLGEIADEPEHAEEMNEFERQELIDALKLKWNKLNAQYQRTTHLVKLDTTGQLRRKEQLESQLKQLEDDIAKLEKGPVLVTGGYYY